MASVRVFVDDAVQGQLPRVCARDGVPTVDAVQRNEEVGGRTGLGVAWLLLIAGPPGWLGLFVIALARSGRSEQLHVELPMSEPAYQRMRTARRLRDRSVLALVGTSVAAAVLLASGRTTLVELGIGIAVAAMAVSFLALVLGTTRYGRETVGVTLDASRRWVTLSNVHPDFVTACRSHEATRADRT